MNVIALVNTKEQESIYKKTKEGAPSDDKTY